MKKLLLLPLLCLTATAFSQSLLSWTPAFPQDNSNLVITVDCNKGNQGLLNFEGGNSNNIYVHVGVITNLSTGPGDWKYVKFAWGSTDPLAKATPLGSNRYQYTINNVRSFFGVPAGETIQKITCIFRNASGGLKQVNSDNSDMYIPVYGASEFAVRLDVPVSEPRYIPWLEPITAAVGSNIPVTAVASKNVNFELSFNGNIINSASNVTSISATATVTTTCLQRIIARGDDGSEIKRDTIDFFIAPATVTAPLPAGVQPGINYAANNTEVTLVLYAPNKTSVVAIGDFSNWALDCANQMKRTADGNYYHLTLTGLTPGTIYKFQYIVDGSIRTTDPYTELVLDPNNDGSISATTFPSMPAYPAAATGIVGTFQTAAPAYTWTTTGYTRPDKKNLVIYELLLRDFLAASNWQTLTDTLTYLKNLGVNAIEVMPFNEFEGNSSWGYNPDFFFAPDKAYGTKNNLKHFIDVAHGMGMAVIMDAVLNHATGLSPLAQLYWNSATSQPAANSPYFNVTSPHPFSVFNDFNHESEATKYHTARYIRHWLTEYRLDGFRWDLSKGFTQKNCGGDVNCWNAYDATRVATWQRYYDSTQAVSPGSYNILEHLGNDDEEADLAGRGMLLWGKMTDQYNQNTMGYASSSSIERAFYKNRAGWTQPHLVTYAESHDEERIMYKNLTFGNSSNAAHDVKTLPVALARTEAMQPFLLLIPGPKMIWEFGELGYDKSIFMCENGTVPTPYGTDVCKLAPKPPLWNYFQETARKRIYDVVAKLNKLRALKPNAFLSNTISGNLGNDLKKHLIITHPDLSVVAIANFDVTAQDLSVTFPAAGTWYNYFTDASFAATGAAQNINLQPGEYRVYTNISFCPTALPAATSPVTYCQFATAAQLTATGTGLLWYTSATGGTGTATAPTPATTAAGTTTYYVSQTSGCESGRLPVVVNITAASPAPTVSTPVSYCLNATATPLTASGTNLLWYAAATGGTGTSTAPTPATTATGSTLYYVTQNSNGCESQRAVITVNVTAITAPPTVSTPVNYCLNATASPLTATGTNLLWYTSATGGTGTPTAPTPSTTTIGSTTYYVSQTQSCGESPRAAIVVEVSGPPASAPTVTTPVNYCINAAATPLTATGSGLLWYTAATGGTGSAAAPVPSTAVAGSTTYYVSQSNSCGESGRAAIVVTVSAPAAPAGLNVTGITATSATLNWTGIAGLFYTAEYKKATAASWTTAATGITASSATVNNLEPGTLYNWRVSANCVAANSGNYAAGDFTTAANIITIPLKDGFGIKVSPNPVGHTAVLDYVIPGSGDVYIQLFSNAGQQLKRVFMPLRTAGQYRFDITRWVKMLPGGSYFIRLQQNGGGIYTQFLKN